MAKRKRNRAPKPDNIIEFKPQTQKESSPIEPAFAPADFQREKEKFHSVIQQQLAQQDFTSEDDMQEFLNQFTGRKMSEVIEEFGDEEEFSDYDDALVLLDMIPEGATDATVRKWAKDAIEVCENCYEAWECLACSYRHKRGHEVFQKAIEMGKKEFAEYLPKEGEEGQLWYHHPARSFMRMCYEMGHFHRFYGKDELAIETYEMLLKWSESDNIGARDMLYALYISNEDFESLDDLFLKYPDDSMLTAEVARVCSTALDEFALLPFPLQVEIRDNPQELSKALLTKHLPKTVKAFKKLHKRNPFVLICLTQPGILSVEDPLHYIVGSAAEAISAAKIMIEAWVSLILPSKIGIALSLPLPKNPNQDDLEWMQDLMLATQESLERE